MSLDIAKWPILTATQYGSDETDGMSVMLRLVLR